MTDWLSEVNEWVSAARVRLAEEAQIPLIDDSGLKMGSLADAFRWEHEDLRDAIEVVYSRDPGDLAVRFVALTASYRLTSFRSELVEDLIADVRRQARKHLEFFVRLRRPAEAEAREIRWEIVNACAIEDLGLACAWADLFECGNADYFRGRLRFLIAIRHAWDDEDEGVGGNLSHWDLPIGAPAKERRAMWNANWLYAAGLGTLQVKIAPEDHDYLLDAVKFLRKGLETSLPSSRFMLARCYIEIGDHHNAARQYQWLLQNCASQLPRWVAEVGAAGIIDDDPKWILSKLHECLIDVYDIAGETDKAVAAAETYIEAFPKQLGTYDRMARLYQKKGDHFKAYEWLRKEVDRNPQFGEDPNISIALALGAIARPNIDEILEKVARAHEEEIRSIGDLLSEYWPGYRSLSAESQLRWAEGEWFRRSSIPHSTGFAAHCFALVAEGELRLHVFDKFRESASGRLRRGDDDEKSGKMLCEYVKGQGRLSLGDMLNITRFSDRPRGPLMRTFADWLRSERPSLLASIPRIRTDRIVGLRNREDHPNPAQSRRRKLRRWRRTAANCWRCF